MSFFDLNTAETGGRTGEQTLLPDDTVARAILTIRPGGAGDGGWFKANKEGGLMIDCEWTITEGPHARRKVWDYMHMSEKATPITMRHLRAVIEGHFGIEPGDMSEAAQAKRKVTIDQLTGLEACILVSVKPARDGYDAKNGVKAVIAPGESKYLASGQAAPATAPAGNVAAFQSPAAFSPPPAAPAAGGIKPQWA